MKPLIYISGPISLGDRILNLSQALIAFRELCGSGFAPVVPSVSMLYAFLVPMEWEEWMSIDLPLVVACDALIRLPGESKGVDLEVECARRNGIPVVYSVTELLALFNMNQAVIV